jgi:hypothetical protein
LTDFLNEATYSVEQFLSLERRIFQTLTWKMLPPTRQTLLNIILKEWDSFVINTYGEDLTALIPDSFPVQQREQFITAYNRRMITVLENNQSAYDRYQDTMQILDAASLDFQINRFSLSSFVAGLIYLMLCKFFEDSNYELFKGPLNSKPLYDEPLETYREVTGNLVFSFLARVLAIPSIEMLDFPLRFLIQFSQLPKARRNLDSNFLVPFIQSRHNEVLSFQTYDPYALSYFDQYRLQHS